MPFAILICELHLPAARSLKAKRRVVKGLIDRMHHRFRVSIAETDFQEMHQRAQISIAAVDAAPSRLERLLDDLRDLAERADDAMVVRWDVECTCGSRCTQDPTIPMKRRSREAKRPRRTPPRRRAKTRRRPK